MAIAIKQCATAFKYASERCRDDYDLVLSAVTQWGGALGFASERLRNDRTIVLAALKENGSNYDCVGEDLREDKELALLAVLGDFSLCQLSDRLRADWDVALTAVRQNPFDLCFVLNPMAFYRQFVLAAVKANGHALRYFNQSFYGDPEIVGWAVANQCEAVQYASPFLQTHPDFADAMARWRDKKRLDEQMLAARSFF